ncbi:MAG: hypothetical protein IJO39_06120 [Clostridia bacterium]|nr:hypothetical protein [Clostridia bacterium]
MQHAVFRVDNAAHLLHFGGRAFPCDREIVAAHPWKGHALLLSADTDCLSLWDADGLIRTARVGVYPQDMALSADAAWICGGADGKLHVLTLPTLREAADIPLPGMPERICLHGADAWVLSLLGEPEVCTALLRTELETSGVQEITRFGGIPGALAVDEKGLWVGVSELVVHLPWQTDVPDLIVEGIGLAERIEVQDNRLVITDGLEGRQFLIRT